MWTNTIDTASDVNPYAATMTNISGNIVTWEFQVTPYIAKRFDFLNKNLQIKPYTGLVWDTFRTRTDGSLQFTATNPTDIRRLELAFKDYSRQPLGVVVGTGVTLFKNATINIEGRFINETALSLSGSIKF